MKKLLSLPPNVVDCFHDITGLSAEEYFCSSDPAGHRLGSGGGTVWLLQQAHDWLNGERCIILHAGGRSQRLPSYAVQGKILMPVPVISGKDGKPLSQSLLSLQLPLYERMMQLAPESLRVMVVSGDVLIRTTEELQPIPEADVVCYGLEMPDAVAKNHGVYVMERTTPQVLKQMLQKPSEETLAALHKDHLCLTDIGVWMLSERAIALLMKKSGELPLPQFYDLYGEFGCALGTNPVLDDAAVHDLSVAIVPLKGGEFYHFGTSREMISSTQAVNRSMDHEMSSIIVQNSEVHCPLTPENHHIWIDNSCVGERWTLTENNIVTGVPKNDWDIRLAPGECIDVVPIGDSDYEVRRYHIDDRVDSDEVATRANLRRLMMPATAVVRACSPVRIDIAGGWTDTPPYCMMEGGNVVNLAIELNSQPPIQATVRPIREPHIILRSVDLGTEECLDTIDQLAGYNIVGSPFSISKAALTLAGFSPRAFGCGIELETYSSVPAGSGLGTSSILAATVLAALNEFCGLGWDKNEIGRRTLELEQMLTTGGGWQDQFGGLSGGVKLLQTEPGPVQTPLETLLPADVFTNPEYAACHLLYYTGITRTAKTILGEIVQRMHQRDPRQMALLAEMKHHALDMSEAIRRRDLTAVGNLIRKSWEQNQLLDSGTNPPAVQQMIALIDDLCWGYKLPGAGGGGFLYMVAKDAEAAARIRQTLTEHQPNPRACFMDMTLSKNGLQVSRIRECKL